MNSGDWMVCGINFHQTPLKVRERISVPPHQSADALSFVMRQQGVRECMILSTCNRSELYLSAEEWVDGKELFCQFAHEVCRADPAQAAGNIYVFQGVDAVKHSFRVASSLDSLVVGEPQILGQMKAAYREADSQGCVGRDFHRWLPEAFAAAKRVRNETGICESAVSVSYAAVQLAKKIFDDLTGKVVVFVGAGKMGELAALHMREAGASSLVVINRTLSRAEEVAALCSGSVVEFDCRAEQVAQADIVICSADAPYPLIRLEDIRPVVTRRQDRPLLLLDISVPRIIDVSLGELHGIYLFNVDDLQKIVEGNRQARQVEAIRAEAILQKELEKFLRKQQTSLIAPEINAMRRQIQSICHTELETLIQATRHLTPEVQKEVERAFHRITQKVTHSAIVQLKKIDNKQPQAEKFPVKDHLSLRSGLQRI